MTAKQLRDALVDVDDNMVILLRVEDDEGNQMMCSPHNAVPDAGCGEVEAFIIDGLDGQCQHEQDAAECGQCKLDATEQ